jgi:hypothetical protein
MLKVYSLCGILLAFFCARSAGALDEDPNKVLSQITKKLGFTGLVHGNTYTYKIARNSMNKSLEINGPDDYYGIATLFYTIYSHMAPFYHPATIYDSTQHKDPYHIGKDAEETFKMLFVFYHALPIKEVLDSVNYYLTTFVKSGTFTYFDC